MPIATNRSRPNLPYVPTQTLPNSNRYQALNKFPPKAEQLDADLNALVDMVNEVAQGVNETAAGIFPGSNNPLNTHKLPTTDGQGNISWTSINANNIGNRVVQTRHVDDGAITSPKIGVRAVGRDQIGLEAVSSENIAPRSITGDKIADSTLPFTKFPLPTIPCLIGGTTTNGGSWYPCPLNPWEVPTVPTGCNGPLGRTLDVIWRNTSGSFHGNKITADTLPGTSLANQTITGSKVAAQTITGDKMVAQTITGDKIAAQTITGNKMANQTITGDKIADASIPASKLSGFGVPFCAGFIKANGQIENGFNISRVSMRATAAASTAASGPLGAVIHPRGATPTVYTILFERPARSINYIVMATPRVTGNPVTINIMHASVTTHQFEVLISDTEGHYTTSPFSFVVYQS